MRAHKRDRFGSEFLHISWSLNGKTLTVYYQRTKRRLLSKQSSYKQRGAASDDILSQHISRRHRYVTTGKSFNQQPTYVKVFWISLKFVVIWLSHEKSEMVPF